MYIVLIENEVVFVDYIFWSYLTSKIFSKKIDTFLHNKFSIINNIYNNLIYNNLL